jgi:hypothetical protein
VRRVVRFAVFRRELALVLRRVAAFRPPRFVVPARFAAVLRRAVVRPEVARVFFAVVLRPPAVFLAVARRRVVLRAPPPVPDVPLSGDGGGGVGVPGIGVGQTEPGSFCADQSVPSSSSCSMIPPRGLIPANAA